MKSRNSGFTGIKRAKRPPRPGAQLFNMEPLQRWQNPAGQYQKSWYETFPGRRLYFIFRLRLYKGRQRQRAPARTPGDDRQLW